MLKALRILFCFFALAGISNCALIEPALAAQEEAVHSESGEESDCCFIHCVTCYPWVAPTSQAITLNSESLSTRVAENLSFLPAPPTRLIFHPPVAL